MNDNSNTASTTFAGDSNPYAKRNIAWGLILIFALITPISVFVAVIIYSLFSIGKISHKVLASFVALYGIVFVSIGGVQSSLNAYGNELLNGVSELRNGEDFFSVFLHLMAKQAPLAILIGGIIGVVYASWRYFRRPEWIKLEFRLTPWQIIKRQLTIKDIKVGKTLPPDGRTLGVNKYGDRIVQTEQESRAHTLVTGGAGAGKTTTMVIGARDLIKRGESLIFIDMKGSDDVPRIIAEMAERYDRPFYHWTSQNPKEEYTGPAKNGPSFYDPIGRGDATRRTNLLIAGREWPQDFYKLMIQNYLQMAFEISMATETPETQMDSFKDIINMLDPHNLKKRSLPLVGDPQYDHLITEINRLADGKIDSQTLTNFESMRQQLSVLRNSIQGQWLRRDPNGQNDINLFEAAHKGAVVVFTIDSASYEENARILGNLLVQDLKTVSGQLMKNPSRYALNVFLDEFSAIGSDNIVTLMARSREAGIPVTLSTQSLGDLRAVSDAFLDQLTGIVSGFIIHRANTSDDAEKYAGLAGKEDQIVHRAGVETRSGLFGGIGIGSGTGSGTIETVEDYIISPTAIQNLKEGEMYYVSKSPSRVEKVEVIREERMKVTNKNDHSATEKDINWKPDEDDYIPLVSEEEKEKYSIDKNLNRFEDKQLENRRALNPFAETETKNHNSENIERIFGSKNIHNEEKNVIQDIPVPHALNNTPMLKSETIQNLTKTLPTLPPRPSMSTKDSPTAPSLPPLPQRDISRRPAPAPKAATKASEGRKYELPSLPSLGQKEGRKALPALPALPERNKPVQGSQSKRIADAKEKMIKAKDNPEKENTQPMIQNW